MYLSAKCYPILFQILINRYLLFFSPPALPFTFPLAPLFCTPTVLLILSELSLESIEQLFRFFSPISSSPFFLFITVSLCVKIDSTWTFNGPEFSLALPCEKAKITCAQLTDVTVWVVSLCMSVSLTVLYSLLTVSDSTAASPLTNEVSKDKERKWENKQQVMERFREWERTSNSLGLGRSKSPCTQMYIIHCSVSILK